MIFCCKCQNINSNQLMQNGEFIGLGNRKVQGQAMLRYCRTQVLSRQKCISWSMSWFCTSLFWSRFSDKFFPLVANMATSNSRFIFYQLPALAERDSHWLAPLDQMPTFRVSVGLASSVLWPLTLEDVHLEREIWVSVLVKMGKEGWLGIPSGQRKPLSTIVWHVIYICLGEWAGNLSQCSHTPKG